MTLTVVASRTPSPAIASDGGYVLRLIGTPEAGDVPPPTLPEAADRAAHHLRTTFPEWLWHWAQSSGVLSLATYPGPVSWWWYAPLSEMSPLRSPLVAELYWLLLVRELVRTLPCDRVRWQGDDPTFARVVAAMLEREGVPVDVQLDPGYGTGEWGLPLARRLRFAWAHLTRCLALRWTGLGGRAPGRPSVVLFSRFPVLWELPPARTRERMFGDWPDALVADGHDVVFAVTCSASAAEIMARRTEWRALARRAPLMFVEALVPLGTLLSAHLDFVFWWRYARWRRRQPSVWFDAMDISPLFWREVTASAISPELPADRVLAAGLTAVLDRTPSARLVALPFEYQPIERAVEVAAASRERMTLGLQTGLFTSNQMGFTFPAAQARRSPADAAHAPVPDRVVAYGDRPRQVFAERLGEDRVFPVGPIRYAYLARPPRASRAELREQHGLPPEAPVVLVATSIVKRESEHILGAAFAAAARRPGTVLALKFHYHLPLGEESARLQRAHPTVSVQVFASDLDDLLTLADALVCGGSSIGVEAMARGCMPLVFRSVGDLPANPMLEVADAVFFWRTPSELEDALSSVLSGDTAAARRRARWPEALAAQLSPLSAEMNTRLNALLRAAGLLGPIPAMPDQVRAVGASPVR